MIGIDRPGAYMMAEERELDIFGFLDGEDAPADLHSKVTQAWRDFAGALGRALPGLPAGGLLEVTLDPTASGTGAAVYGVGVRAEESGGLTALAVSNADLPDGYRMGRKAIASMVALGWSPPGVVAGSGESFGMAGAPDEADQVAKVITRTLRDVYGAPHPAFLVYAASDARAEPLPVAALGTARHASTIDDVVQLVPSDLDKLDLADRVKIVVSSLLKTEELNLDADGEINIRAGSAMVFVRVRDNPPMIDVYSPLLKEVEVSEKLLLRLSELTNRMPIGRLFSTDDTVWASIPVFGRDFQASHLMLAVQVMTGLADELDDRLHGEFGGKRFFGDTDAPAVAAAPERIGQYL